MNIYKHNTASVFVDPQNTFTPLCPEELPVPEGDKIVDELNALLDFTSVHLASGDEHPVDALYFADDEHPQFSPAPKGEDMDIRWNRHGVVGTYGADLIKGLPRKGDYDLYIAKGTRADQHPYGMCYYDLSEKEPSGAIEFLKQRKIVTVLIGGLATDYCVKNSALQLARAGFKVIVNLAACRGIDPDTVEQAVIEMEACGVCFVQNASQLRSVEN